MLKSIVLDNFKKILATNYLLLIKGPYLVYINCSKNQVFFTYLFNNHHFLLIFTHLTPIITNFPIFLLTFSCYAILH